MSRRYLSTLNLDLNRLFSEGAKFLANPCIRLSQEEKDISGNYLQLAASVSRLRSEKLSKPKSNNGLRKQQKKSPQRAIAANSREVPTLREKMK